MDSNSINNWFILRTMFHELRHRVDHFLIYFNLFSTCETKRMLFNELNLNTIHLSRLCTYASFDLDR